MARERVSLLALRNERQPATRGEVKKINEIFINNHHRREEGTEVQGPFLHNKKSVIKVRFPSHSPRSLYVHMKQHT